MREQFNASCYVSVELIGATNKTEGVSNEGKVQSKVWFSCTFGWRHLLMLCKKNQTVMEKSLD